MTEPEITDALGRVWTHKSRDVYTHDGMAWPREFVLAPTIGWPSREAITASGYDWCDACRRGALSR